MENDMKCRFCGSKKNILWAKEPKKYYQCSDCLFISVDPIPTNNELDDHYRDYHDLNHQESLEKNSMREESYKQEAQWLKKYIDFKSIKEGGFSVCDYGASGGYFLDVIKSLVGNSSLSLYGDDKSLPAIEKLKEKKYYYNFDLNKPSGKFDLVILRGVIEHVPDFKELLVKITESLKDNGFLFISATPNGVSTGAQLYRHNWVQHHYPSHIQHFSAHHFDYHLVKNNVIRVDSTDLYYNSIYKKESDIVAFSKFINKENYNFTNCMSQDINNDLRHAFFGSMLTLLYQKKNNI
jgi:2-polyprenyl-3-methyl-5-hydroxy-6-metoxy-1,4-benzoquinol methylase